MAVKEVVLPFNKFPGADTLLGPEMRSTGEVRRVGGRRVVGRRNQLGYEKRSTD